MSAKPTISIGVPVYNGERFIRETLDSILRQSFTDFEVVISDNASTDGTEEICRAYAAKDRRIRYDRTEKNLGAAENYNRVFSAACGRYFKWAAHDDLCAPEFLERCFDVLENDPSAVLCYTNSIFIDERGEHIRVFDEDVDYTDPRPHRRLRTWLFDMPGGWCHPVFGLMRSSVLAQTPLIGKYVASDYVLIGELALRGGLHRIPERLFYRREHSDRSTLPRMGLEGMTRWFDTSVKPGGTYLPRWRWLFGYVRATGRVPMGVREKLRTMKVILRWAIRIRNKLAEDVVVAAKTRARQRKSRASSFNQE